VTPVMATLRATVVSLLHGCGTNRIAKARCHPATRYDDVLARVQVSYRPAIPPHPLYRCLTKLPGRV